MFTLQSIQLLLAMLIRSRLQRLAARGTGPVRRYCSSTLTAPIGIVSGGSRGIGKAIALDLLRNNYKVASACFGLLGELAPAPITKLTNPFSSSSWP